MRGAVYFLIFFAGIFNITIMTASANAISESRDSTYKHIYKQITAKNTKAAQKLLDSLAKHITQTEDSIAISLLQSELLRNKREVKMARMLLKQLNPEHIQYNELRSLYFYQQSKVATTPQEAKTYIHKGISAKKKGTATGIVDLSNYFNSAGLYAQKLGQIDSAARYYQKAINTAIEIEGKPENHDDIALFYQNLALPSAIQQDYVTAKKHLHKSITILNREKEANTGDLGRNYNNLGRIHFLTGIMDSAEYYYSKSEKIRAKKLSDTDKALAVLYLNMGGFFAVMPNFEKAQSYFQKAKFIYQNSGNEESHGYYKAILNLGFSLLKQKKYSNAVSNFNMVTGSKYSDLKIKAYRHLGDCYIELNKKKLANSAFLKSIEIAVTNKKSNAHDLALAYSRYGVLLRQQNKIHEANHYILKGQNILRNLQGNYDRDIAISYIYLARNNLFNKDYKVALKNIDEALSTLNEDSNKEPKNNFDDLITHESFIPTAIVLKGKILYNIYLDNNDLSNLLNAKEEIKKGIKLIENRKTDYQYGSNKLLITEYSENDYNLMLEVLNELYQVTGEQKYLAELFTYMEKSKASVLLSSITESKAKVTAKIPDSILKREKYLNSRINGLKKLVYDEKQKTNNTNQEKVNEWENMIFDLQNDYQKLTEYIKKNYYEFYRLQLNPEIMTLEQTVEKLNENQAIIAYSFLEDKTLTLLITKSSQKLHVQDLTHSEIDSLINKIRSGLTVENFANFDNADYRRFVRSTRQLYKHLLEPIEKNIKNKKLVFIPDGKLGFIPLEILLTQPVRNSGNMNFKTLPYLINDYAVSYAYSVTLLLTEHNKTIPAKNKVLSMAPAYNNISRMPVDSLFVNRQQSTILMPLEGAKEEVKNIKSIFRSDSWMDENATEHNFVDHATDYAILHLAMHTILDDANPMYSKLVFYQEEEPENGEDNLLNTYELFDLTLNAELAVLSACNTGFGKLQQGEGIMSLARGFLYAGVPSIMMTLWPIDDASSADMMQYFYQNLAEGMEKDIALRQAKLDFLESSGMLNSHPHFWASFVSIGPDDAINHTRSKNTTHWWIIVGGILATALAFFIIKQIRTKG